jgi:site-specific recombinase XerD
VTRLQHQRDLDRNAGWVEMPMALVRKYPNAGREWSWQWTFPATRTYRDSATGQHRRHHLHESVIQRAVHDAIRAAGVMKHASCHTFRHSFATHLLQGVAFLPCHPEGTKAPATRLSRAA